MKKSLLVLLLAFIAVGYSVHAQKKTTTGTTATCPKPLNPSAQLHGTLWYNVKLNWLMPEGIDTSSSSATISKFYDNGPFITSQGTGVNGASRSVRTSGSYTTGGIITKDDGKSIADDFTLDATTKIAYIDFYGYYISYTDTITSPFTSIYVKIYSGKPSQTSTPIWGDFTTNRLLESSFYRVYRQISSEDANNVTRPVFKVRAKIDATFPAGNYWVEITADRKTTTVYPVVVPITISGQANLGNAIMRTSSTAAFSDWDDSAPGFSGTNGKQGLTFTVYQSASDAISGYNVYRDGVKLNTNVLTERTYTDNVTTEGVYNYGISTVCKAGGESDTVGLRVEMPIDPCDIAITTFPFTESFENGVTPPCWTQVCEGDDKQWEYRVGGYGNKNPSTTHSGKFNAYAGDLSKVSNVRLITPMMDVTGLTSPLLTFFFAQGESSQYPDGKHDTLKVYYKNTPNGNWVEIVKYKELLNDWKKAALTLPEPTATYWIAFEAKLSGGRGVVLDDVQVSDSNESAGCGGIGNLAYTLHNPTWNSVNLTWSPSSTDKKSTTATGEDTLLFTNGTIVTDYGAGYMGKDISKASNTFLGSVVQKNLGQGSESSMSDDFTLKDTSYISYMNFYAFHYNTSTTSTISEVYVQIYDKAPNEGGHVIWGGAAEDIMNTTYFSNIYRTPNALPLDRNRPIFVVKANINKSFNPGTYWVDVTFKGNVAYYAYMPPVVSSSGNAVYFTKYPGKDWESRAWTDNSNEKNPLGMPLDIYGFKGTTPTWTYNVYRNDVLLTKTPIKSTNYRDVAPGAGNYTYGVTKIWNTGCESPKTKVSFTMEADPCLSSSRIPFAEGFETGMMPNCWTQDHVAGETEWAVISANLSEPPTAHGGNFKMALQYQPSTGGVGVVTKLITPMLDLSTSDSTILLNFWHTQDSAQGGSYDSLFIYYKNTASGSWKLLTKYTNVITDWEEAKIILPNPTNTYWIAFEGHIGGGKSILLDSVTINPSGYQSITDPKSSDNSVHIFPNPAKTRVSVQSDKIIQNIEVYNAMGQAVDNIRVSGLQQDINVDSYSTGVYLIKVVMQDQSVSTQRVVISR